MTRHTTLLPLFCAILLSGCAVLTPNRTPVPIERHDDAVIVGPTPIRYWGDAPPPHMEALTVRLRGALNAAYDAAGRPPGGLTSSMLALSGGAWDGAYRAGVFAGWSACGGRPEFRLVSGVSTGALLAPFVFLGPRYDERMIRAFTTDFDDDALPMLDIFNVLFGALGLADTAPLARHIEKFADEAMLDDIAAEYRKGRNLLIGTTNLDAERPVTWNIGALATSGRPDRVALFQKILLASSSVPGAFTPVLIDVDLDGEAHTELHVDGGVKNSVFLLPPNFDATSLSDLDFDHEISVFVLQNNKLEPQAENVDLGLGAIVERSVGALIRGQSRGDIARIYLSSRRAGFNFYLGSVPNAFRPPDGVAVGFNADYMQAAFEAGFAEGARGYRWRTAPPGFQPPRMQRRFRSICTRDERPVATVAAQP